MKNDAPSRSVRTTLITPSAPTPVRRSQTAATSSSVERALVIEVDDHHEVVAGPLVLRELERLGHGAQGCQHVVDDLDRAALARLEPADAGIAPEPGHLPSRQVLRASHRSLPGFLEGEPTVEVADELRVPDRLAST